MSEVSDRERRSGNGDSPHFQLDLLGGDVAEENGDCPHFRVSARARRLSIRVYPDARVEVVVPPRARPRDVQEFLGAHREWIDAKRAHALRNRPGPQVFPPPSIEFVATGECWRLHIASSSGALRVVERGDGPDRMLSVTGAGAGTASAVRKALRKWLLRAARPRLTPRVAALSASNGIPYSQVAIRRQRSRWGSCSARGTISLNACLLFQRPDVVDYLVIHELTHVRYMNHSARFWQTVERNCADWRALDRELVQGWRNVPRWVFSDT
ncbi:MAG: SprT family zinc-dependent metalloprotease [Pseudomonadota bacterium]